MNKTTNYEFNIPYKADNESADIDPISDNFVTIDTELAKKIDKINGKGLSTNDYTDTDKSIVDNVQEALAGKLDKKTGYSDSMVYGVEPDGLQSVYPIMFVFDPNTNVGGLPYYESGGILKVGTPTAEYDATNKSYVDGAIESAITTTLNTEV